jgi:hypothetical protein
VLCSAESCGVLALVVWLGCLSALERIADLRQMSLGVR